MSNDEADRETAGGLDVSEASWEANESPADSFRADNGGWAAQLISHRRLGPDLHQSPALAGDLSGNGNVALSELSGGLRFSAFAASADFTGRFLPMPFIAAADRYTPGPVKLSFQAGQLAIRAQSGHTIREAPSPDGFVEVTIDGQPHSSNPASTSFDRALQGAAAAKVTGIHFEGGGQNRLIVGSQQHAGGFRVQATGATVLAENLVTAGPLVIQAPNITVTGALQGSAVSLAAEEWLTINATARVDAELAASGGVVRVAAAVFVNSGQLHADGPVGGQINIAASKILNAGPITADGTAPAGSGGEVHIAFTDSYIATSHALISTSSAAGAGGQVTIDGGRAGHLFSSGRQIAIGAAGGAVNLFGRDIVLAGAMIDSSGQMSGGSIRLGGDIQSTDPGVEDAETVTVTSPSILRVDAVRSGGGGRLSVQASQGTIFDGTASARGGPGGGPGGIIDLSGRGDLSYDGSSDAGAVSGQPGTLLLDPKNITIADAPAGVFPQYDLIDPHPTTGGGFGRSVSALSNGNIVVTNPTDDFGGANAGAVYLFDGSSGALIASLVGSNAGDQVGSPGITALNNGNYVVQSLLWNESRGAVTWGDGSTGVSGTVSDANSLVGSNPRDQVGQSGITPLSNGNYVVDSPHWNGELGAATWGDGTTGITGTISDANSLIGSNPGDQIGSHGIASLSNGNYVVQSPHWNDGRGAATWGDGDTGVSGSPSDANSLVGTDAGEEVGANDIVPLTNGNYVVESSNWNGGLGAITWGDGSIGLRGTVSDANSLVDTNPGDPLGVTALTNGNYVVASPNRGGTRGAVIWEDGSTPVSGTISQANSLVGNPGDYIGSTGIVPLTNGNYVVESLAWNGGRGAATWENGSSAVVGVVSEANSLVGSRPGDLVGIVTPLTNGNYAVSSTSWNGSRGAVTWEDGTAPVSDTVSDANSLVGSNPGDLVGVVVPLSNGNYVVGSPFWNGQRGAATWGDGTTGIRGTVSEANSLVGSNPGDSVEEGGTIAITALSNGNYVVRSPHWNGGFFLGRGAVTWGDGTMGTRGPVSQANSLVGSSPGDRLGDSVAAFSNGDYVVVSSNWNDQRGAVTWLKGTTGQTLDGAGVVTPQNSLLGQAANTFLGLAVLDPSQRSFIAQGGGRITVGLTDPNQFSYAGGQVQTLTLTPDFLTRTLDTGTAVVLQASNDITVNSPITVNAGGLGGALTLQVGRAININANITTDNGDLTLIANDQLANGVVDSQRDPGTAVITMAPGTALQTGSGALDVEVRDGAGLTNTDSGAISLQNISAGSISIVNYGLAPGSDVVLGPVTTLGTQSYTSPNGTILVTGNLTTSDSPITFNNSVALNANLTLSAGSSTVDFAAGTITPGAGVLTIAGGVSLAGLTTVSLAVNGPDPGSYAQLAASGPITLGGTLNLLLAFDPPVGSSFEILTNTGSAPISGTFDGLDEGTVFTQGGFQFQVTYQAGTGGDSIVLTRVA